MASQEQKPRLVVIGNGMVGQRFLERAVGHGLSDDWTITTFCEESRVAYDRVALSSFFEGRTAEDLSLVDDGFARRSGVDLRVGQRATGIDRARRVVITSSGDEVPYDRIVLATGSYPFVPDITGNRREGVFVYRTIDDLQDIRAWADWPGVCTGVVIGGGLLGLEAANALRNLNLETHVVEFSPQLMPAQLDPVGGATLRTHVEALGLGVHTDTATNAIHGEGGAGPVTGLRFGDGTLLEAQMVVFSAGIRPRDFLAESSGLLRGERGGFVVDDELRTSDPDIFAIGECASHRGTTYGLVAPGYQMAEVVADGLCGRGTTFEGADLNAKLKLLGVDVASFGDAHGRQASAESIIFEDPRAGIYQRLVVCRDSGQVLGGQLVGDATAYSQLSMMSLGAMATPDDPGAMLGSMVVGSGDPGACGVAALADDAQICNCESVDKATLTEAVAAGCHVIGDLQAITRAGTGCGACVPMVTDLLRGELTRAGVAVSSALCEHFEYSRQELYDLVRVRGHASFAEVLSAHGRGLGCGTCRPVVGSILASRSTGYILDGDQAGLQDTNDHFLANMQKNGTYSVVPRVPGGEITPDQLIALGQIAKDFGLYTKITGGQRIDMFGATIGELPEIWRRVLDAGLESGHAYGKALRTVKSCVGQTWCRYGVADSTTMAIRIEERYRGLRAPHKFKAAVSGCARECAEAQSKDFGVIATERGWDLYVGGNGGKTPRHADLFATDLDDETLIRYIDRFLMFYIRTADRLERTSVWLGKLDGGIEHLRSVVIDDSLGLAAEFELEMGRHVDAYECEWKATLESPQRLARFVTFVNAPGEEDPEIVFVQERGQLRPANQDERETAVAIR